MQNWSDLSVVEPWLGGREGRQILEGSAISAVGVGPNDLVGHPSLKHDQEEVQGGGPVLYRAAPFLGRLCDGQVKYHPDRVVRGERPRSQVTFRS